MIHFWRCCLCHHADPHINSLLKGYSGIRLSTVEKLLELLNKGVTPLYPWKRLSELLETLLLFLIWFYQCWALDVPTTRRTSQWSRSLRSCWNWKDPISCQEICLDQWYDCPNRYRCSCDLWWYPIAQTLWYRWCSLNGSSQWNYQSIRRRPSFHPPTSGQLATARNIRNLLEGSKNTTVATQQRVQDPYTLRCILKYMEPARILLLT